MSQERVDSHPHRLNIRPLQVAIAVPSQPRGLMAEHVLQRLHVCAGLDRQRRCGVPKLMQLEVVDDLPVDVFAGEELGGCDDLRPPSPPDVGPRMWPPAESGNTNACDSACSRSSATNWGRLTCVRCRRVSTSWPGCRAASRSDIIYPNGPDLRRAGRDRRSSYFGAQE